MFVALDLRPLATNASELQQLTTLLEESRSAPGRVVSRYRRDWVRARAADLATQLAAITQRQVQWHDDSIGQQEIMKLFWVRSTGTLSDLRTLATMRSELEQSQALSILYPTNLRQCSFKGLTPSTHQVVRIYSVAARDPGAADVIVGVTLGKTRETLPNVSSVICRAEWHVINIPALPPGGFAVMFPLAADMDPSITLREAKSRVAAGLKVSLEKSAEIEGFHLRARDVGLFTLILQLAILVYQLALVKQLENNPLAATSLYGSVTLMRNAWAVAITILGNLAAPGIAAWLCFTFLLPTSIVGRIAMECCIAALNTLLFRSTCMLWRRPA